MVKEVFPFEILGISDESVTIKDNVGSATAVKLYQEIEPWALMSIIESNGERIAVFENHRDIKGSILYVGSKRTVASFPKTLEPTYIREESCYLGRTLPDVTEREEDVLGEEILAADDDPSYEKVAPCLPPLRIPTFIGTRHSVEKIVFDYDGFNIHYFDAGNIIPQIAPRDPLGGVEAREKQEVLHGLVGGWLPVVRFVFLIGDSRYWEEVVFAEEESTRFWTQPVWYRLLLVEEGKVKESHYFHHHLPYPPRGEPERKGFYKALLKVYIELGKVLEPAMKIEVPEKSINVSDFCLHSLVREIITRVRDHPKYGYPPPGWGIPPIPGWVILGYGYSSVDSFQDIFNSCVITHLEWGLIDIARRYIDDYFTEFVRDDGSIDTRGPETGQYGRMLTSLAQYYNYTKDHHLILKHRKKILAILNLLLSLLEDSREVPKEDATYGIIRGWSEHDSCLRADPYRRYMLPYFSNSAEVCRGFHDLGQVWINIGRRLSREDLIKEGEELIKQFEESRRDLYNSIEKSMLRDLDPPYLSGVAGAKEPYDKIKEKDPWGAGIIKGRCYIEMLHSGCLSRDMVETIIRYQTKHRGRLLGLPGGNPYMAGFLTYGYGYGLLQHDLVREFLLCYYAHMAHIYTRGTWTATEWGNVDRSKPSAPYCSPAQLTIPAFTKWMLVFEDPFSPTVWLARGVPRAWLEDGKTISVKGAPTKWGTLSYNISSNLKHAKIKVELDLPEEGFCASINLRLRIPGKQKMQSVDINGKSWTNFDPEEETVMLPAGSKARIDMEVATSRLR